MLKWIEEQIKKGQGTSQNGLRNKLKRTEEHLKMD